jgi:hypothetical protein
MLAEEEKQFLDANLSSIVKPNHMTDERMTFGYSENSKGCEQDEIT